MSELKTRLPLVIEAVDESGPLGLRAHSVCHYGEQNGDAMRDPEMCFELGFAGGPHLIPYFRRNDFVAVEQVSRAIIRDHYVALLELQKQHEKFAETTICVCRVTKKPSRTSAFSAKQGVSVRSRTCGLTVFWRAHRAAGRNPLGFSLHPFPAPFVGCAAGVKFLLLHLSLARYAGRHSGLKIV